MPGVLIVEALAQTGAVAILSVEENKGKTAYFGGMDRVKFKKKGSSRRQTHAWNARSLSRKGPVGVGKATATVDGKVAVICRAYIYDRLGLVKICFRRF